MNEIPSFGKGMRKVCCSAYAHAMCTECVRNMTMSRVQRAPDELTPEERENGEYSLPCPGTSTRPRTGNPCRGTISMSTARDLLHKQEKLVFDGKCKEFRDHAVATKARAEAWAECEELLKYGEVDVDFDSLKRKRGCDEKETERALQHELRNPNYDEGRPSGEEPKYRAFMCPRCSTGPVTREACTDLAAHHGQRNVHGVAVNNACAHCGFFGRDSNEWSAWDGVFRIAGNAVGAGSSSETAPTVAPDTDHASADTAAANEQGVTRPAWFDEVMATLFTIFEDRDHETLVAAALASDGNADTAIDRVLM
jgi:hypothetical protein